MLSLAARGESLTEMRAALLPTPARRAAGGEGIPPTRVVAFTGSGGVGKSTLIGKLIPHVRSQSLKVAVLAWGSLFWEPRSLQIATGFVPFGPVLPIRELR